jgi:hypothetical protein
VKTFACLGAAKFAGGTIQRQGVAASFVEIMR